MAGRKIAYLERHLDGQVEVVAGRFSSEPFWRRRELHHLQDLRSKNISHFSLPNIPQLKSWMPLGENSFCVHKSVIDYTVMLNTRHLFANYLPFPVKRGLEWVNYFLITFLGRSQSRRWFFWEFSSETLQTSKLRCRLRIGHFLEKKFGFHHILRGNYNYAGYVHRSLQDESD